MRALVAEQCREMRVLRVTSGAGGRDPCRLCSDIGRAETASGVGGGAERGAGGGAEGGAARGVMKGRGSIPGGCGKEGG